MPDRSQEFLTAQRALAELARTEALIRASTEAAEVAMWNICPETGETWFSDIWYTLLGYEPGAFEPSFDVFMDMMHPDDHASTIAAYMDLIEGRTERYHADFRLKAKDGHWRWIAATGAKMDRSTQDLPFLVCGMQMDVSWRKEAERKLEETARSAHEHKERLRILAENSPAALFEFRMDADDTVTFPYISPGVLRLLAVSQEDIDADGAAVFRNILPEDMPNVQAAIMESRQNLSHFYVRYRVRHPDGQLRWIQATSLPKRRSDGATTWFGSLYEITREVEREEMLADARDRAVEMERRMRELALLDGLTGLPNRRHFDETLRDRQSGKRHVSNAPRAVLIRIDLDRFKSVNDTLGHAAGDAVLCHVAEVVRNSIRKGDFAARLGGDEFSIILKQGSTTEDARNTAERIQAELRRPFLHQGRVCRFGASFGIASSDDGTITSGDLMSFADAALYKAKERGRNRLEVFDTTLHTAIIDARKLASEIEASLEKEEFEPFYQPQVCARTGELAGIEVLARWNSPRHGFITAGRFMPVADQIRASAMIDQIMIEKTVDVVKHWHSQGFFPRKIGFNVSADRLRDAAMAGSARRLQDLGVSVAFELLESILLEKQDDIVRYNLDLIRELGILIEVDDFGSGHASILGLLEARPDILKIDRRLSENLVESAASRELIQSVVGIAKALQIKTTVEGVETREQADILRGLDCDCLQGYHFGKPMNAKAFLDWLQPNHISVQPGGPERV